MHAVDSGSRGEHALSRHLRAAREVEHLVVDAVQVGVEQGPLPGRTSHILCLESKLASSRQSLQPVVFREEVLLPPLLQENVVSVVVLVGDEFARLLRRERQRIIWEMYSNDELDMYLASIPSMCKYLRTIQSPTALVIWVMQ